MKKSLLFLSSIGCLMLPVITHADTPTAQIKKVDKPGATAAVAKPAPSQDRVIYYVTAEPRTGSQIPMLYRRYNGRIDSASNAAVYGSTDIQNTGTIDLATALSKLDSSISIGRSH